MEVWFFPSVSFTMLIWMVKNKIEGSLRMITLKSFSEIMKYEKLLYSLQKDYWATLAFFFFLFSLLPFFSYLTLLFYSFYPFAFLNLSY